MSAYPEYYLRVSADRTTISFCPTDANAPLISSMLICDAIKVFQHVARSVYYNQGADDDDEGPICEVHTATARWWLCGFGAYSRAQRGNPAILIQGTRRISDGFDSAGVEVFQDVGEPVDVMLPLDKAMEMFGVPKGSL